MRGKPVKLPDQYNLYSHNEYLDKLHKFGKTLAREYTTKTGAKSIYEENLKLLKKIETIRIHLELVLDEVKKELNYEQQ